MNCATCHWFEPSASAAGFLDAVDYGTCHLADSANGHALHDDPPMYVLDTAETAAELKVLPTFGCVSWTEHPRVKGTCR